MDLRGKFKTFLEDSKQKLLLSPTSSQDGDAPLPRLVLPPPGSARSALTDSDLEVSQLLSDPLADQQILDLIPSQYFRPGSGFEPFPTVFRSYMFLGLPDPDPLVRLRGMNSDLDPFVNKQR
jgi:hypothetical protein